MRRLFAEPGAPAIHHPARVRRGGIRAQALQLRPFAQQAAQKRVGKPGHLRPVGLLGKLDALVDRGVRRDAVEEQELVRTEPQRDDDAQVHVGAGVPQSL